MFIHKQEEDSGGDSISHQYMFNLNIESQLHTKYYIKSLVYICVCAYLYNTFVKTKPQWWGMSKAHRHNSGSLPMATDRIAWAKTKALLNHIPKVYKIVICEYILDGQIDDQWIIYKHRDDR